MSYKIGKESLLKQMIILDAHCPFVKFKTQVDWAESHKFLKVEFPLNILSGRVTYEIQFGHIERPTHFNTSWDSAKFEVCGHKWADCSEFNFGVAILNDSKYGWSCIDNKLRLSLLRSSKCPDESADMGKHEFTYAVMPHSGSFQQAGVIQSSYNLNNPLLISNIYGVKDDITSQSFISISNQSVILEAFKMSEYDSKKCIIRLFESFGGQASTEVTFNFGLKSIKCCNLLEEETNEIPVVRSGDSTIIEVLFNPFQIISLSITLF